MYSPKQIFGSRLFGNIYNLFLLYGFSHIIPILLMPFLLNTIGADNYGRVNFALSVAFYFQVVNESGFDLSNVRHIVANREDRQKMSEIVSAILCSKFLIFAVLAAVYVPLVFMVPMLREYWLLYILVFLRIPGICLSLGWLFRSMENLKYVTRITVVVKSLCILPIFFVVKSQDDYIWVAVFFLLQELLGGLASMIVARRVYRIRFVSLRLSTVWFYLKESAPFFVATFVTRVYQMSNTFFLGVFCGEYAVGIYTAAEKLYFAYVAFMSPLMSQVFYPYFLRVKKFEVINRIVRLVIIGNLAVLGIGYFVAPYILPLFMKVELGQIIAYFNMFLIVLAVVIPSEMVGYPYLGSMGRVDEVNRSAVIAAAVYMCGVGVLIVFDGIGVAWLIGMQLLANLSCLCCRLFYIGRARIRPAV